MSDIPCERLCIDFCNKYEEAEAEIRRQQAEIERLKKIESMAMACDGIDMGTHYWVSIDGWDDLMKAVWS